MQQWRKAYLEKKRNEREIKNWYIFHISTSGYNVFVFVCVFVWAWRMISCWTSIKRSHLSDHFVTDFLWINLLTVAFEESKSTSTIAHTDGIRVDFRYGRSDCSVQRQFNFFFRIIIIMLLHVSDGLSTWSILIFAFALLFETVFQQLIKWKWSIPPSISKLYDLTNIRDGMVQMIYTICMYRSGFFCVLAEWFLCFHFAEFSRSTLAIRRYKSMTHIYNFNSFDFLLCAFIAQASESMHCKIIRRRELKKQQKKKQQLAIATAFIINFEMQTQTRLYRAVYSNDISVRNEHSHTSFALHWFCHLCVCVWFFYLLESNKFCDIERHIQRVIKYLLFFCNWLIFDLKRFLNKKTEMWKGDFCDTYRRQHAYNQHIALKWPLTGIDHTLFVYL